MKIEQHNRQKSTYKMGVNIFSDLSGEEYLALFGGHPETQSWKGFFKSLKIKATRFFRSYQPEPPVESSAQSALKLTSRSFDELSKKQVDWVAAGALNPVRSQANCGSCFAFATVSAVEAAYFIKHGKLIELSEQHMLDCGVQSEFEIGGCSYGAVPEACDSYIRKYGLQLQSDYPYFGEDRVCKRDKEPAVRIKATNNKITNTIELLEEVIHGPVTVFIEHNMEFQSYHTGVLDLKYPCGFKPNHMVSVVGFDLTADPPFIKLRNSHGQTVGEGGYIRVALAGPEDVGFCGITSVAFRPILAD
jgi:C1A family cysteine protease